jgi:hypothetical protein
VSGIVVLGSGRPVRASTEETPAMSDEYDDDFEQDEDEGGEDDGGEDDGDDEGDD